MNEQYWLSCRDLIELMDYLDFRHLDRKKRLFGIAACLRVEELLPHERYRQGLRAYEREVDLPSVFITDRDVLDAVGHAEIDLLLTRADDPELPASSMALEAVSALLTGNCRRAVWLAREAAIRNQGDEAAEMRTQCDLLRDVFGNPFRPVTLSQSWLTPTVVSLARRMYESRDFSPMPILADALQDAGCEVEDVLKHCREPGPHVRGCWVADLILVKE